MTVTGEGAKVLMYSSTDALRIGDRAYVSHQDHVEIGDHWLGALIDYRARSRCAASRTSQTRAR